MRRGSLPLWLAATLCGTPIAGAGEAPAGKAPLTRLEIESHSAAPFDTASLRGKPTVLYVWGYWCRACERSTPEMVALAERHRDVNFVFINTDSPPSPVTRTHPKLPANIADLRVIRAAFGDEAMRKKDFRFAELGLVFGIPQYFQIDAAGRIEASGNGSRYPRQIAAWLDGGGGR